MTKTVLMIASCLHKGASVRFVSAPQEWEGKDYTLTMTIKRSKSGEFSVSDATLRCEDTSR